MSCQRFNFKSLFSWINLLKICFLWMLRKLRIGTSWKAGLRRYACRIDDETINPFVDRRDVQHSINKKNSFGYRDSSERKKKKSTCTLVTICYSKWICICYVLERTEAMEFIIFGNFSRVWFSAHTLSFGWTCFIFVCIVSFYQRFSFSSHGLTLNRFQSIHSLGTIEAWRSACFCPVLVAVIAYAAHLRMFLMTNCWRTANHIPTKHNVRFEWRFLSS